MDWLKNLYQQYLQSDIPAASLLRGDTSEFLPSVNRNLDQNLSLLSTPEGAMDLVNPMAKVGGLLGTFIGKGSKLWNPTSYAKALKMEKTGAKAEDIWKETGNAKFADGQWRQEISDKGSTIKADFIVPGGYYDAQNIGELLDHPELFKAYPDAKNVDFSQMTAKDWDGTVRTGASYSPKSYEKGIEYPHRITLYEDRLASPVSTKSSVLHENQHYIQELENFAKGGNPESIVTMLQDLAKQKRKDARKMFDLSSNLDPLYSKIIKPGARDKGLKLEEEARALDDAALKANLSNEQKFNMYKKMAGEAEARLTQRRMGLTDAERRANFPYKYETDYGLDVPFNELIVQGILSK